MDRLLDYFRHQAKIIEKVFYFIFCLKCILLSDHVLLCYYKECIWSGKTIHQHLSDGNQRFRENLKNKENILLICFLQSLSVVSIFPLIFISHKVIVWWKVSGAHRRDSRFNPPPLQCSSYIKPLTSGNAGCTQLAGSNVNQLTLRLQNRHKLDILMVQ